MEGGWNKLLRAFLVSLLLAARLLLIEDGDQFWGVVIECHNVFINHVFIIVILTTFLDDGFLGYAYWISSVSRDV